MAPVAGTAFYHLCEYPYGLPLRELCELVYRQFEPTWGMSSLTVTISKFNKRAKQHRWGVRMRSKRGHGVSLYQIWIVREEERAD